MAIFPKILKTSPIRGRLYPGGRARAKLVLRWEEMERTRRLLWEQHQQFCIRNVLKVWFGVDNTVNC